MRPFYTKGVIKLKILINLTSKPPWSKTGPTLFSKKKGWLAKIRNPENAFFIKKPKLLITVFLSSYGTNLDLKFEAIFRKSCRGLFEEKCVFWVTDFGTSYKNIKRFVILDLILLPDGPLGGCPPRCPWGPRRWFFLHDLYKYDLYVSYFITFSLKKLFFGCLRKITFLGYGCDPDLGEPLIYIFNQSIIKIRKAQIVWIHNEVWIVHKVAFILFPSFRSSISTLSHSIKDS